MASFSVITNYRTTLAQSMTSSQATAVLSSVTVQGHAITASDYGSRLYITINPGAANMEVVRASTNSGTTFTLDKRGLAWYGTDDSELSAYKFAHVAGEPVVISNVKNIYDNLVDTFSDETIAGIKTFSSFPVKSGTLVPTSAAQLATKSYVDSGGSGAASYDQMIIGGTAGEALAIGQTAYLKTSDQRWWKTDADVFATAAGVEIGIVQSTAAAGGDSVNILTEGLDAGQTGLTAGTSYYLSGTAGSITATPGAIARFVGVAITTTTLMFIPNEVEENVTSGISGEALAIGAWVYFKTSDSKWWRVDADAAATATGVQIGVVQTTAAAGDAVVLVRVRGVDQTQTGLSGGTKYYLSGTIGTISSTQGAFPRYVGTALSATRLLLADSTNLFAVEQHGQQIYAATATGNDTYVVACNPTVPALFNGLTLRIKLDVANTGPATLNVDGTGALAIVNGVSTALVTGDLLANQIITVTYNSTGTVWQLVSPSAALVTGAVADTQHTHNFSRIFGRQNTQVTHTGNTSMTTLATFTLPAGAMGTNGKVRVSVLGSSSGGAGNKTWEVTFGGFQLGGFSQLAGDAGEFNSFAVEVVNRNSASSQIAYVTCAFDLNDATLSAFSNNSSGSTIDTTAAVTVLVRGQLANSADTITLESATAEVLYSA